MVSKKTLNEDNLARLGAERLAALLIEVSTGNAAMKRRLRFELAGEVGAKEVAREVRKRIKTISKAKSFIDWTKARAFAADLDTQVHMIREKVSSEEPEEAFELLWQFVELAPSVYERSNDSSGNIGDIFYDACSEMGEVAIQARVNPVALAQRVFDAICPDGNNYGQYNDLIEFMGPALGDEGLDHLKGLVNDFSKLPLPEERNIKAHRLHFGEGQIGYSLDGDFVKRMRERFVSLTLQQIADSQGDVDSYISQQSEDTITNPLVAADIANRLLAVDRACEALKYLNAVTTNHAHTWQFTEWNNARIDTLETLGEKEELINFLWECFQRTLGSDYLRNLMKQLPDFEDFEYERRAFEWAASYTDIHQALYFFVDWQAYEQGAKLTVERHKDLNGDLYQSLSPAADALQGSYPLAATLIRRSMIDSSLNEGRSSRYKHAARHLLECQSANAILNDYGEFITHDDYVNQLKIKHGRKISFWSFLPDDFISKHLSP